MKSSKHDGLNPTLKKSRSYIISLPNTQEAQETFDQTDEFKINENAGEK